VRITILNTINKVVYHLNQYLKVTPWKVIENINTQSVKNKKITNI
jgi:hypothetical protein